MSYLWVFLMDRGIDRGVDIWRFWEDGEHFTETESLLDTVSIVDLLNTSTSDLQPFTSITAERQETNAPFGKVRHKKLFDHFQVWLTYQTIYYSSLHHPRVTTIFKISCFPSFVQTDSLPKNRFYSTRQNLIFSQKQKENNDVCQIGVSKAFSHTFCY